MHEINQDLPVENEFYMDSNYRPLLLRISNHITKANLEKLKFLCSDAIEEGELEEINSPLKLFKALERRQLLAIDELSLLRGLLISVECIQLVRELDDFISRREVELLGLKRLSQKRKQGTLCRKNHPSAEPDCRETGLAAACEYEGQVLYIISSFKYWKTLSVPHASSSYYYHQQSLILRWLKISQYVKFLHSPINTFYPCP